MNKSNEFTEAHSDKELDLEDRLITVLLTVGIPFLIGFIAWGVIIYAFAEWKLY